ncbi:MAG: glycosyltransferase [Peptococcales bacterium]|jgi:glycosyltransferase involved in cell wall biosynthesis
MVEKRVSVAMAVYNSEKYIRDQIESILSQLTEDDELVISYNKSTDCTWDIICEYEKKDKRVRVINCSTKGIQPNFNNAIINTTGKYIFLSDHDDVWVNSKVEKVLKTFNEKNATIVMHSRTVTDEKLNPIKHVNFDNNKYSNKFIRNFISNKYCGSCMAFRRDLIPLICPLPSKVVYHDVWIGLLGSIYGTVTLLNEPLILYRRHGLNESSDSRRNLYIIFKERILIGFNIFKRVIKLLKKG